MTPALTATLARTARAMSAAKRPWWIIGSAAVALHGVAELEVADIDLLAAPADARRLAAAWGVALTAEAPHPQFRSEVHFQWLGATPPVDVMAGLEARGPAGWRKVTPSTRVGIRVGDEILYAPERGELLEILALFGRPKDRERAALLRAIS